MFGIRGRLRHNLVRRKERKTNHIIGEYRKGTVSEFRIIPGIMTKSKICLETVVY
jgi:hypothetical protein